MGRHNASSEHRSRIPNGRTRLVGKGSHSFFQEIAHIPLGLRPWLPQSVINPEITRADDRSCPTILDYFGIRDPGRRPGRNPFRSHDRRQTLPKGRPIWRYGRSGQRDRRTIRLHERARHRKQYAPLRLHAYAHAHEEHVHTRGAPAMEQIFGILLS